MDCECIPLNKKTNNLSNQFKNNWAAINWHSFKTQLFLRSGPKSISSFLCHSAFSLWTPVHSLRANTINWRAAKFLLLLVWLLLVGGSRSSLSSLSKFRIRWLGNLYVFITSSSDTPKTSAWVDCSTLSWISAIAPPSNNCHHIKCK